MTPAILVENKSDDEEKDSFTAMFIFMGALFLTFTFYAIFILICNARSRAPVVPEIQPHRPLRRTKGLLSPRVDEANQALKDIALGPKKSTIVRFHIDGVVVGIDE